MVEEKKPEEPPTIYVIQLQGYLDPEWSEWLYDMAIEQDGDVTTLHGSLPDQTVLHSVLDRIRDMNLQLISVNQIVSDGQKVNCEGKGESHEA